MNRLKKFGACQRGSTAVEFGLIGMVLFTCTIGTIEVGRALFMMNELAHAADRASRVVMMQFDIPEEDLTTAVRNQDLLVGLIPENLAVASAPEPATSTFRTVTLSYPFTPMLTGFTLAPVTLTAARQVPR